jgi:hypothetical protein
MSDLTRKDHVMIGPRFGTGGRPAAVLFAVLAVAASTVTACGGATREQATPQASSPAAAPAGEHSHDDGGHEEGPAGGGLTPVQNGFRLALLRAPSAAGQHGELSFRLTGPTGSAQTQFQVVHDKSMHVFFVRKDLGDYYHVHPVMAPDGTWSVPLTVRRPGPYRLVTDFAALDDQNQPHKLVLGSDAEIAGPYSPDPLPAPARATSVDGYEVHVDGDLVAGQTSMMTVRITKAGAPVTNIERYLGALAHLAAFHEGDLEVVHMHPQEASSDGASPADLMVHADFPVAGLYRVFIQFQTDGQVHTAPITLAVQ